MKIEKSGCKIVFVNGDLARRIRPISEAEFLRQQAEAHAGRNSERSVFDAKTGEFTPEGQAAIERFYELNRDALDQAVLDLSKPRHN
jgi:hypothetical protein